MRYPKNVRINRHRWLVIDHRYHHVGRFAAHAGQALKLLNGAWHFAPKLFREQLAQASQMLGLVVGVRNATNKRENIVGRSYA